MSKADEMFRKLNFIKSYDKGYKATHYKLRHFEDEFVFYETTEIIDINTDSINMQELQAINLKVKELRLDRKRK